MSAVPEQELSKQRPAVKRKRFCSLRDQAPACGNRGFERAANKNVVDQIPDRCLTRAGIVKESPVATNAQPLGGVGPKAPLMNVDPDKYQIAVWPVAELNKA